ncbi:MAG TPA: hypothetical protein VES90_11260 [Candidatus Eisenbacteria bacterium]|nr:hypothetical protein [Candidatus Eisenbacteria bacterium]
MQLFGARNPERLLDLGRFGDGSLEAEARRDQGAGPGNAELQNLTTSDLRQSLTPLLCSGRDAC